MRKKIVVFFVTIHLFFIFAQIYKQSSLTQLTYIKQKLLAQQKSLYIKKQELIHTFHVHQDRSLIKNFAQQELHMIPIQLSHIKTLTIVAL